jgi:hypothetical protein
MYESTAEERKVEISDEKLSELVRRHRVLLFTDELPGIVRESIGQHDTKLGARFLRAVVTFHILTTGESDRAKWRNLYQEFDEMRLPGFDRLDLLGAYISYYCALCAWKANELPMVKASRALMAETLMQTVSRKVSDMDSHMLQALVNFLLAQLLMEQVALTEEKQKWHAVDSEVEKQVKRERALNFFKSACINRIWLYAHLAKQPDTPLFRYVATMIIDAYDSFKTMFSGPAYHQAQCPIEKQMYEEAKARANATFSAK